MKNKISMFLVLLACVFFLINSIQIESSGTERTNTSQIQSAPHRILIKYKKQRNLSIQSAVKRAAENLYSLKEIQYFSFIDVYLYKTGLDNRLDTRSVIEKLNKNAAVLFAEPDYMVKADIIPNDPLFANLWGLHNTGQTGGSADADIDAPEAWDITTGSPNVVVAVLDTGVDYNHEDLSANMWTNPGEIPANGIDDDGNGYIDDVFGINAIEETGDPLDDNNHGTHVSGTIAAVGNNGIGIAGVCWQAKIMALKFLDNEGVGYISNSIICIEYALAKGVKILNNSWGGDGYSDSLKDAIKACEDAGVLFIAAAGNNGRNTDITPHYPSAFENPNILSVAATNQNGNLASYSNYGKISVDVAAPGTSIQSTTPNNTYQYMNGTSMATPHVSGLAVLLKSQNPSLSWLDIKTQILNRVDKKASLMPTLLTGGRINAHKVFLSEQQLPYLSLSPSTLSFGAVLYGVKTQDQKFQISNTGTGTIDWTLTENSGWLSTSPTSGSGDGSITVTVNPSGLATGFYSTSIQVDAINAFNSPLFININLDIKTLSNSTPPFGVFDTPIDGTAGVRGTIPVTGWVLDDIEASTVKIYREPGGGMVAPEESNLIYIGDAVFVDGARPDVEQAYPNYPLHYRAGWGYMLLTNSLPSQGNGTFRLHAVAYDKDGLSVSLGAKTIYCDNANSIKPFGSIDEPAQGALISGASWIFGWVLTAQPNFIPTDGSTLNIWVDGLYIGHPVYDQFRADVAAQFPDYANSNGPVGSFLLDTTTYENGVHTLSWSARDSAGNTEGIGSRYFTIFNTGTAGAVQEKVSQTMHLGRYDSADLMRELLINFEAVRIRKGYSEHTKPEIVNPDPYGTVEIEIKEVERIEIDLGEGSNFQGFLIVGKRLKPLPIGSTLDTEKGIFTWQPGPGFIGEYELVFITKNEYRIQRKINVRVRIRPKFGIYKLDLFQDAKANGKAAESRHND